MSSDKAKAFKAEVLAALASGAKAPIDQRPPTGTVPPRIAPRERGAAGREAPALDPGRREP